MVFTLICIVNAALCDITARKQNEFGVWEIFLPNNADGSPSIPHGSRVKVFITWCSYLLLYKIGCHLDVGMLLIVKQTAGMVAFGGGGGGGGVGSFLLIFTL